VFAATCSFLLQCTPYEGAGIGVQEEGRFVKTENRKGQRVALKKEVLINGLIKAQSLDLSMGGLYVYTGRTFPLGQIVTVMLPLNAKFINLRARIRHQQQSIGMGLQFLSMTADQEADISDFIRSASAAPAADARKTVMLVDGAESARMMNKGRLILEGYAVQEAEDAKQAVAMLEKAKIDLVILDLSTDPADGYRVLATIRLKPEWKHLPVLVLSPRSSIDEIARAKEAGATEFLDKMMTPPLKLSQRVKTYLSEKH
jgi:CheY-like chemotaxis protein